MSQLPAISLALTAAFIFGLSSISAKRGLKSVDVHTGAIITLMTTVMIYLLSAPLWMRGEDWFTRGFWIFVANGFLHPMISMYMALQALRRAGPTVASTLSATTPMFAAVMAVTLLDESLNSAIVTGMLGTVAGVIVLTWRKGGFNVVALSALAFASTAALIRAINHVVTNYGLDYLPNVYMATFVSFSTSLIGSLIWYCCRYRRLPAIRLNRGSLWFVVNGLLFAIAVLAMFAALFYGDVVVVSPLINIFPVFTLAAAWLLGEETINRRTLAGVGVVISGITLISIAGSRSA